MEHNYGTVTPIVCPYCGEEMDCATGADDQTAIPEAGDLSVCFGCGGVLVFDPTLKPVIITDAEWGLLEQGLRDHLIDISRTIRSRIA